MKTIVTSAAGIPVIASSAVPWLSAAEMRAVDDVMVGELGIALKQMMENAGRNLAVLARLLLGGVRLGSAQGSRGGELPSGARQKRRRRSTNWSSSAAIIEVAASEGSLAWISTPTPEEHGQRKGTIR